MLGHSKYFESTKKITFTMINFHNTYKALVTLSRQDVGCNFLYVQTFMLI